MPEKIVYIVEALYKRDDMLRVLCHKINWMAENSHYEVHVVLTEKPRRAFAYELSPKAHVVNFDINFEDINKRFYYEKPYLHLKRQWSYRKELKKFLKKIQPKAIIVPAKEERWCLWSLCGDYHKIVELNESKKLYKKLWITRIPILLNQIMSYFRRGFYLLPLRRMDTFVVNSEESKKSWQQTFSNITVIRPPIIDYPEKPVDMTNNKVIALGRFEKGEGFELLIHAWEKIGRKYPNWRLLLCGNGDQEPYKSMIRAKRLSKSILCYPLPENRSERFVQSAILAQTSETDVHENWIMEAMAYGIPCVAIETPCGYKELIHDEKNGFLIKTNHQMDLSIKLRMLIHNEELRKKMGLQAREDVGAYTLEATMRQWVELLDSIKEEMKE